MIAVSASRTEQGIRHRAMLARQRERQERELELEQLERQCIERIAGYDVAGFKTSTLLEFALRDRWVAPRPPRIVRSRFQQIEQRACKLFGVTVSALRSPRKPKELVFARHFISYWALRQTELSTTQIGRLLGDRDHTTIMNSRDRYRELRAKMGRNLKPAR